MAGKSYKFGVSTTIDYTVEIRTQIELISLVGFDFISIGANLSHCLYDSSEDFESVARYAKDKGLMIESAHAPFGSEYDIAHNDPLQRNLALESLLGFCCRSDDYKIPIVIVHPHDYFYDSKEACLERIFESLSRLRKETPPGIKIALENLPGKPCSWLFSRMMEEFDDSQYGFCYDSSHENISGRPFHLLRKYYSRLTTCHLSDNQGKEDQHLIPGEGIINWSRAKLYIDQSEKLVNLLFEIGTGKKLAIPLEDFLRHGLESAQSIFREA